MKFVVAALPFALALLFGVPTVGSAHALYHHARHHHYRHWHYAGRHHYEHHAARGHRRHVRYAARDEHRHIGGLVHEDTAAGNITVAAGAAAKFKDLIAALVAKGFRGDVGCYAASGISRIACTIPATPAISRRPKRTARSRSCTIPVRSSAASACATAVHSAIAAMSIPERHLLIVDSTRCSTATPAASVGMSPRTHRRRVPPARARCRRICRL